MPTTETPAPDAVKMASIIAILESAAGDSIFLRLPSAVASQPDPYAEAFILPNIIGALRSIDGMRKALAEAISISERFAPSEIVPDEQIQRWRKALEVQS